MNCPLCYAELDLSQPIHNIVICPDCWRSIVVENDTVRVARDTDTTVLADRELAALKAIRKSYRENSPV